MGKNQQMLKLFVVLFLSTAFIFSSSHFGVKAVEGLSKVDGKFAEGTTIGMLDISGKTKEEAVNLLEEKYIEWIKAISIELQYGEKAAPFDINLFQLDPNQTVASIKDGQANTAAIAVDKITVTEQLESVFPLLKSDDIDWDKLTQTLNQAAAQFQAGSHSFNLYNDFLLADRIQKDAVISEAVVKVTDIPSELLSVINQKPKIEMNENGTFSLLEYASKNNLDNSESLNILATGIYQAFLPSNFTIVERNISPSLPSYASLGYEAMVDKAQQADLIVKNPNKTMYTLELQATDNQFKVTLKGQKLLYDYKITPKDEQKLKPKTIIQYSSSVSPGKTVIQNNGSEGKIIKVYRDVYQEEQFLRSELVSEDYYPAAFKVEVHGLTESSQAATTIPTETSTTTNSTDTSVEESNMSQTDLQSTTDSDIWGKPNEQPK